ncbi:MAG TPA: tetratricopeptide repeat protein [Vicinamibacterales bacterium]|nr:tetratricopeptide repeat protein [Vicinamibacterales bacterium]
MTLRMFAACAAVLLLANTAYIAAAASPTVAYMTNVLVHVVVGMVVWLAGIALLVRDRAFRDSRPVRMAMAALTVAVLFAAVLVSVGNLLEFRWVLIAHVATAAVAVAAFLPFAWKLGRFGTAFLAVTVLLIVLPLGAALWTAARPNPADRIVNPSMAPLSMHEEGGGTGSPFFPSSAQTDVGGTIPSDFFMDSQRCAECHADIYKQWEASAHHFASFNNQFYRKSIEYMQSVVGTQPSKWCAGCHDHAVFFNGRFERPIVEQIDTPEAQAGLACTSCHSIAKVDSSMGNGGFTIAYPPLHHLASSRQPVIRALDRMLTYLDPEPHRRTFMKPFMRLDSAEFCATCHKVHLDVPVNDYRWFRGFNDYDAWQASGVSGQGARSFYYPEKSSTCVDCHMPKVPSRDAGRHADGLVHSHRFPAANTALPFVNNDAEQMKVTTDFLTSGFVSVDIFAVAPIDERAPGTPMVRRSGGPEAMSAFAVGEEAETNAPVMIREVGELAAPLDRAAPILAPGSTVRLDVVVRTRKIGHFFPGGTVDAFDVWLEVVGRDAGGRTVFWSGRVEDEGRGPVETGAHFYRSYQLDAHGNPIDKRNAWQSRSLLYVRLIPPGAADVAHYRVKIPEDARGPLTFTARLQYRKFAHSYTQFAYAGQPVPGQETGRVGKAFDDRRFSFDPADIPANVSGQIKDRIPDLPIITLASASAALQVGAGPPPSQWRTVVDAASRERWNDWGIGLLLQGDLKGAEYAFTQVTKAEPGYADGWLNVARALIQEGETEAAKPFIREALARDSSLGRIHFFKAMIEKADGDYAAAIASLERVTQQYPRDRVALNQLARVLFLDRRYQEALAVLDRVAQVDPEDVQMHYTAMLAARGLGDERRAEAAERLFLRFKADEAAQAITARPRLLKPEDNNERQPIHEHETVPLTRNRR